MKLADTWICLQPRTSSKQIFVSIINRIFSLFPVIFLSKFVEIKQVLSPASSIFYGGVTGT